jgi:predicted nucleic acid-binding protein
VRRYLLDTAPLSAYLLNRPGAVTLIQPWIARRETATSILAYAEIVEYLRGLPSLPRRQLELRELLVEVAPHVLTYRILERYVDIRRQLRPPHGPGLIGDIDTLIAATALERRLTVVTTDADFQRLPGLHVLLVPRAQLRQH